VKPDDWSLQPGDFADVRRHARLALEGAGGLGRFPTPVSDVMDHAKVSLAEEDALDEVFLTKLHRKAGAALRRALSKVRGVLDAVARIAYIDRTLHVVKQTFLKLHETAHAILPHQRSLYAIVEDCDMTIAPDVSEQFDREANVFAAEVLFQLDSFIEESRSKPFGIRVPMDLSKKYGASIYASIRQYVAKNHHACAVLVIEPPEPRAPTGFTAALRRVVASQDFERRFGEMDWPDSFTPYDDIGAIIPVGGRRMSRPRPLVLMDRNGDRNECIAESFTQGHQVFVLVHCVATLSRKTIVLPPIANTAQSRA